MSNILLVIFVLFLASLSYEAFADVYIPTDEYLGYFDSNNVYTVIGNVKNENDFAILPTITISIIDDSQISSQIITHAPIPAQKELPFKIKLPQARDPILLDPILTFTKTNHLQVPLEVLYDETLIKHDDGHLTGRVQNTGNSTIYFPTIHAIVHGYDGTLDVVQNIKLIEKIEPDQIVEFSMYPDPAITDDVFYYSCFAPVDTTVVPVMANKNGGKFDFRYDSGAWFSAASFDESGTTLTMRGYNSYPIETFANFEFAPISGNEEFSVIFGGESVDFIQSMDEMGYWHVAFSVKPTYQGILEISGFQVGLPPDMPLVPEWVKTQAGWWATEQISDSEFQKGINFLIEKQIITSYNKDWSIPSWLKVLSGWWVEDKISDEDYINALTFLINQHTLE